MVAYDDYGVPVGAYSEPETLAHQTYRTARAFCIYRVKPVAGKILLDGRSKKWTWRSFLTLVKVLVVVWAVVLYWGERSVFADSVGACRWEEWENWASDANPHRLIFIADPQLVDPHTYPGRPWPLNTLTVQFTDQYIRRTYSKMQKVLYPDSIVFLGDLFDGGREWSTRTTQSPEKQYQKYGDSFWLKEYNRFGSIFFDHWGDAGLDPRHGQRGKKIISSLPGNHDLGFAKGIQIGVRKRFNAYFGEGNRMDVIGNHTFVSLDSVSLSALGEPNPESLEELWKPSVDFLASAKIHKRKLVQRELRMQQGLLPYPRFSHDIVNDKELAKAELRHADGDITEFPTILLTHVPLYRAQGTPCGPQREHWPPTPPPKGQTEPLTNDDRNAIRVAGGYQYQNVLRQEITVDLAKKIGDIQYAFSGDDHDYCEVLHKDYESAGGHGIREITVKSISWAMGVRKPGVVLASLWNPVDEHGDSLLAEPGAPTMQTHLCLLPDQLSIFIRYAALFGLTLLTLALRAALIAAGKLGSVVQSTNNSPLLPITEHSSTAENEKADPLFHRQTDAAFDSTSSNSSTSSERGKLQVRSSNARTRSVSPSGYGLPAAQAGAKYSYPLVQHAGYYGPSEEEMLMKKDANMKVWGSVSAKKPKPRKKGVALFWHEFVGSLLRVGGLVFVGYFWLIRRW